MNGWGRLVTWWNQKKKLKKKYTYNKAKLIEFLAKFKDEIDTEEITIEEEEVRIPDSDMEVEYGFKIEQGQSKIETGIKRKDS